MPTAIPGVRLAGCKLRLAFTLAFATAAGCGWDSAPPIEEGSQASREQYDVRITTLPPPNPSPAPPEVSSPEVPQDPVALQRERAARRQRLSLYYVSAYEQFGRKNPRWDDTAREALIKWATLRSHRSDPNGMEAWKLIGSFSRKQESYELAREEEHKVWEALHKAVEAQCDDPLILTLFSRLSNGRRSADINDYALIAYWTAAAEGMRKSGYPAILRADTLARAGAYTGSRSFFLRQQLDPAQRLLDEAMTLMPAVAAEARGNRDEARAVYHLSRILVDAWSHLPEREPPPLLLAYEKVDAALREFNVSRADRLLLEAYTCVQLACRARGPDTAIEVTDDGWADFDANLARAEETLSEAAELDPDCIDVTRLMLCVETGLGRDQARLESWFQRAMRLNGDDYFACLAMMEYLSPHWYGSEAEMLSFGRKCLKTENWDGRLPFILSEVHRILEADSLNKAGRAHGLGYFSRPYVWNDMRAIYEPFLASHPNARVEKSTYARYAALAGEYEVADRLFKELGNDWQPRPTDRDYALLRDKAAAEVAKRRR
jgi:hypothetical protein